MIRRNPTRIELKLEDLNEFECIQKTDKKKISPIGVVGSGPEAAKLLRQERIGCITASNPGSASSSVITASASRQLPHVHYRDRTRIETVPANTANATPPIQHSSNITTPAGQTIAGFGGVTSSSLVVQTPSSFDEFGTGIIADSSTSNMTLSSPSSLTTPTNNNPDEEAVGASANANANSDNNITTSSMEMSLDYLND